jgi:glucose/mannose-6-phosphate isomerase
MGGSAIGADVAATLARTHGARPVEVVRGYAQPLSDPHVMVIACSCSGETEETLDAFSAAVEDKRMALAITTGGGLAARARAAGTPLLTYDWDGPPRAAFGFGLFTLLGVLARLDVIDIDPNELEAALAAIEEDTARYALAAPNNPAKRLAVEIGDRIPVIIGADFLDVAARRFASEVNENAKRWAFAASLPEFDHNAIQTLDGPVETTKTLAALLFDAPCVHPRNRTRVAHTAAAIQRAGGFATILETGGKYPLEAIVRATTLASWVSFYLAMLGGMDPTPTASLDAFKADMAKDEA